MGRADIQAKTNLAYAQTALSDMKREPSQRATTAFLSALESFDPEYVQIHASYKIGKGRNASVEISHNEPKETVVVISPRGNTRPVQCHGILSNILNQGHTVLGASHYLDAGDSAKTFRSHESVPFVPWSGVSYTSDAAPVLHVKLADTPGLSEVSFWARFTDRELTPIVGFDGVNPLAYQEQMEELVHAYPRIEVWAGHKPFWHGYQCIPGASEETVAKAAKGPELEKLVKQVHEILSVSLRTKIEGLRDTGSHGKRPF